MNIIPSAMISNNKIIEYIKPRIDYCTHSYSLYKDKWILFIHLKDGSKYEAMDYIEDRFGPININDFATINLIILREFLKK